MHEYSASLSGYLTYLGLADIAAYDAANRTKDFTSPEGKLLLYALVRLLRPRRVIEIGTALGHSTSWLAAALRDVGNGTLVTVDNYGQTWGGISKNDQAARARVGAAGGAMIVEYVRSNSIRYMREQPDRSVDIVYVDGDHSFKVATGDIRQAMRVATKLVIVHDTFSRPNRMVRKACAKLGGGLWLDAFRGFYLVNPRKP